MARERLGLPASNLRKRRRKRAYRLAAFWTFATLLVVGGVAALSYMPQIQIEEVAIAGLSTIPEAEVRTAIERKLEGKYLFVFPRRNIFLYPRRDIAATLALAFPKLKDVAVGFKSFSSIGVEALERDPSALWCGAAPQEDMCYLIDEKGFVFAPAPEFSGVVYMKYFGELAGDGVLRGHFLTPEAYHSLSSLISALGAAIGDEPGEVSVEGSDVTLSFLEGYGVKFSLDTAPADVVKRLELAFEAEPLRSVKHSNISYIDLRFGNRLYYLLK